MSNEQPTAPEWTVRRLRFDAMLNPNKSAVALSDDDLASFILMNAVGQRGGLDTSVTKTVGEVRDGYTYFADGDICVAKITPCFENGKGALAEELINGTAFGTTELHVLRPCSRLDPRFLFYLTIADDFRKIGESEMLGAGGQKRVPERFIKDWMPPLPLLATQHQIARFLDEKTARIDALIQKKRALLERLAEKRQALITQAVTKGLDPDAAMKHSRIEWLGRVPAHWEVRRVKQIAKLESGHTPDKKVDSYWENCQIPWVSLNDTGALREHDYIHDTAFKINELGLDNSSARLLPTNAVVFTRDATIGESAITTRPMAVSQHIIAWLCDADVVMPEFLLFAIYGMTGELLRLTNGSTIGTIGLGDVKSLSIALPPSEDQRAIVQHVFRHKEHIANARRKLLVSIERLREYRSALITAAVTGQMDIPESADMGSPVDEAEATLDTEVP